jgi:lysozyme
MSNYTVLGCDVSKWQREMDWAKAKAAGIKFAFIRAGSIDGITGECYEDYQFQRNAAEAPKHLPVGFYWYWRPDDGTGKWGAVKQAAYFANLVKGKPYRWLAADIETAGDAVHARYFCEEVHRLTGRRPPMVYTNPNTILYLLRGDRSWMDDYDLWQAEYDPSPRSLEPWKSAGKRALVWQYTSTGGGPKYGAKSAGFDLNLALPEFLQETQPEPEPPPPPKPPVPPADDEKWLELANWISATEGRLDGIESERAQTQSSIVSLTARVAALEAKAHEHGVIDPVPVRVPPSPLPVQPEPGYTWVRVVNKTNARRVHGANKAGRPIMVLYPDDNAPVSERVQFEPGGRRLKVKQEVVTADGGGKYYELHPGEVTAGLPALYLLKDDVMLDP